MKKQIFCGLGQMFYEWHKSDRVKFAYGTGGKDLDREIERISKLIEYVKKKKESLLEGKV